MDPTDTMKGAEADWAIPQPPLSLDLNQGYVKRTEFGERWVIQNRR